MNSNNSEIKLHIVLDNIRSAFNVGSIFRTADAVGGCKIHLCGITSPVDNPKLAKTALGATESVPSQYYNSTEDAVCELKDAGVKIVSVELTEDAKHFQEFTYPEPVALILGHERNGVSKTILDLSDDVVYIPMNGIKESLNVANSAAIIMYEAVRKNSNRMAR